MRIAVDISPIITGSSSAHKVRGGGKYITLLKDNLERFDKKNTYLFTPHPRKVDVDLVHYPYFDPFFVTLPYINKTKTLVTVHDVIPLAHRKEFPVGLRGLAKWGINKRLLKRVSGVITDSDASANEIHKVIGIEKKRIYPVPLAVDEDFKFLSLSDKQKQSFLSRYSLPNEFILYVGDVTWNKNLPRLVDAIVKADIPLVMVGKALTEKDYDLTNAWNRDRLIVEEKTKNNPLFIKMGFLAIADLVTLYNCASLLCMPSLDEGFGLPILEAMRCGCPVVISRSGSLPEVGGDAAEYIDAKDTEQIAITIKKMIQDKPQLESLSRKGLVQSSKFNLEKMIRETVSIYEFYQ